MKSIKYLSSIVMAAMALIGVTSCSDDNDSNPVIDKNPTEFVVNTPALADQYVQLSASNTVNLTWSAPNYSYLALATYKVQVGLVNADGTYKWNTNSKTGENAFLETTYNSCSADLNGEEIAWAINNLDGITTKSDYKDKGFRQIAMRIYSCVCDGQGNEVAKSGIFSNAVIFKNMAAYQAVKEKGWIYLVGSPTGWTGPTADNSTYYNDWRLFETEIGNKIYEGTFDLPANPQFRFYKALTGWDDDSMGSQTDDSGVNIELNDKGVYEGELVSASKSKGSWVITNFAGGKITITANLNNNTVKFAIAQ